MNPRPSLIPASGENVFLDRDETATMRRKRALKAVDRDLRPRGEIDQNGRQRLRPGGDVDLVGILRRRV